MADADASPNPVGNGDPITEAEALRRLRLTDDPSAQYYAAWWLGRNRSTHPEAVPLLQAALRQRRPRDPGAGVEENAVARNAARALGKLGRSAEAAIPDLLDTLEDQDHGLREAAARSLGDLKALAAVEPLRRRLAPGPAVAGALPLIQSGRIKPIAIPAAERASSLPNVPTFIENGLKDFVIDSWVGLLAPARTPRPIIDRLNTVLNEVLNDADAKARLDKMGITPVPGTPEQFHASIKRDLERYAEVVKAAKIQAD